MVFSLGAVFNYYSVFETVLDADSVGAISGSFSNTIFFLYGMYVYLLVRTDKRRQDKTRQARTRQDKTRHDKTRQDKTRHDKTRQDETRQG